MRNENNIEKMSTADLKCQKLVEKWRKMDKNQKTLDEIEQLAKSGNNAGLEKRLAGWNLAFGTAGVRARMGAGFNQLNDLTVIMLSYGFAQHLLSEKQKQSTMNGNDTTPNRINVVVGYDGRYNSKRFADLASNVFVQHGIRVYFFADCVPTPVVSFAVVELGCNAGLMITASHNPKEDNGYKAYWSNGAQILAPHDKEICRIAASVLDGQSDMKDEYWDMDMLERNKELLELADPVLEKYYQKEAALCCFYKELNAKSQLRITYSAFHGVGSKWVHQMFQQFGLPPENVSIVKEQDQPNPDFPTVPFPNPEEGSRVLQLCFKTADANQATLVLANDPDADRLQMAEKQSNGDWLVFTGNEMGALLTWWIWTQWRRRNPNADPSNVFVLNSAVSSQIVQTMAQKEGFQNRVSLTGFKWIGNLADQLRANGKTVILAWEESIGFATGSTHDKDGVSAAAVFAEMANWMRHERQCNLQQMLFTIYGEYGFHLCRNSYWIVPGPDVTKRLFTEMRATGYPKMLEVRGEGDDKAQKQSIKFVRDLTTGYDNSQPDNKATLPLSSTSEMVTFTLETGSVITLRASGTEPKIKYYIELRTEPGKTRDDLGEVEAALNQLETAVVQSLLQPQIYGLIPRDQ